MSARYAGAGIMRNTGALLRTSGVLSSYRNHGQWCPESAVMRRVTRRLPQQRAKPTETPRHVGHADDRPGSLHCRLRSLSTRLMQGRSHQRLHGGESALWLSDPCRKAGARCGAGPPGALVPVSPWQGRSIHVPHAAIKDSGHSPEWPCCPRAVCRVRLHATSAPQRHPHSNRHKDRRVSAASAPRPPSWPWRCSSKPR